MSVIPNYPRSAPPTDKTSLTDGIYTKGNFWTKQTTVGWQNRQVSITIDLGEIKPVGSISFNTARNTKVGVDFPKNVFAFISDDNNNFKYAGDIVNSSDNTSGSYEVKKFLLNDINALARYVTVVVIPKGKFAFCDEIEVLSGNKSAAALTASVSKSAIKNFSDSLLKLNYEKNRVNKLMGNVSGFAANAGKEYVSDADLKKAKDNIYQQRAVKFKSQFNTSFVLEKYNPWDSLHELYNPEKNSDSLNYTFTVLQNGVEYGAFVITNSSSFSAIFNIKADNENSSTATLEIFNVPFVPGGDYSYVADPLIKTDTANIGAGVSQLFLFKVSGKKAGSANASVTIQSGNKKDIIKIRTDVLSLSMPDDYLPNANVWAYLNYPMLADRNAAAAADLALHHIKTIVVPPSMLPSMQSNNYTKLLNYLSNFKKINKVLLFTNYKSAANKNGYSGGEFMSQAWKKNFNAWYNNLLKALSQNGYSNIPVYLYPYDEPRDSQIKDFVTLLKWAKKAIPDIKFYATLTNREAVDNILPLVDIAQIQERPHLLDDLPKHNGEIWTYHNASPARSLSPYSFYRLMSWQAFVRDVTGIGFWSYADEGKNKTLNLVSDNLNDPKSSYSVIYDGPDKTIISTRRWEAFSLGMQDYTILKLYAKKFGIQKAKDIANAVLADQVNINKADAARNEMLKNLQ